MQSPRSSAAGSNGRGLFGGWVLSQSFLQPSAKSSCQTLLPGLYC